MLIQVVWHHSCVENSKVVACQQDIVVFSFVRGYIQERFHTQGVCLHPQQYFYLRVFKLQPVDFGSHLRQFVSVQPIGEVPRSVVGYCYGLKALCHRLLHIVLDASLSVGINCMGMMVEDHAIF